MSLNASIVDPKLFSEKDKMKLVDELYQVHDQIFDGVDKDQFTNYVVDSKAHITNIFIQKHQDQAVGYGAIHFYKFDTLEERIGVIRMEAGLIPDFRSGNNQLHIFALFKVLQFIISHPNRKIYFLGSLVHPSSYVALTNLSKHVWPTMAQPVPCEQIKSIVSRLSDLFDLIPVESSNPHVVQVGWKTREAQQSRDQWNLVPKPSAQFYIQQNPNYQDGHGLITILPMNLKNVMDIGVALLQKKQKKIIKKFWMQSRLNPNVMKKSLPNLFSTTI
ncbi:hypothetical protein EC844_1287 [Acinetobacter calcoaceticus]|uniref:Uncharacterized protein n=1 Tax=Acinetobacter calcoaceticus TaxID=471 RepID=A0A4R1XEG5_ACICA|nr:hypothetical protein EC844_1287 [Acinetobacter calcoaceticus]